MSIDGEVLVDLVRDELAFPNLPNEMRVANCWLLDFAFSVVPDQSLTIESRIQPASDWWGMSATGEWLDAIALEGENGEQACVGTRDPEWLCHQFDLELIKASHHPNRPPLSFSATYRTRRAGLLTFQMACALSHPTRFDGRNSSPWFAVDLAMSS